MKEWIGERVTSMILRLNASVFDFQIYYSLVCDSEQINFSVLLFFFLTCEKGIIISNTYIGMFWVIERDNV